MPGRGEIELFSKGEKIVFGFVGICAGLFILAVTAGLLVLTYQTINPVCAP